MSSMLVRFSARGSAAKARLLIALLLSSLLSACFWQGGTLSFGWDEQVQLRGSEVIQVHVEVLYQRIGKNFKKYDRLIRRDTTLRFDSGPPYGQVTQLFKGFSPLFLDRKDGVWYCVIYGAYYSGARQTPGQDWGDHEGPHDQRAIRLVQGRWQPISMDELPVEFKVPNMLIGKGTAEELEEFTRSLVSLERKTEWLRRHPYDYADNQLMRPLQRALPLKIDSSQRP